MARPSVDKPVDALDVIYSQDQVIADLFDMWHRISEHLRDGGEDVDLRWRRGSAVKLLLQHLAVREAAKEALVRRIRRTGHDDLATNLDGDGVARRERLAALDELARGHQAMSLNFPAIDAVVADLAARFAGERERTKVPSCQRQRRSWALPEKRGLPGARSVRMQSMTHPSPVPRWYDRVPAVKAFLAFYDHLRPAPSGAANPGGR